MASMTALDQYSPSFMDEGPSPTRYQTFPKEQYRPFPAATTTTPTTTTMDSSDAEKSVQSSEQDSSEQEVYSEWLTWERRFIVTCAAMAALFSPLSANIYFPIFGTLADVLGVSDTDINLTVTTYMIFQGITPMFVAALSDGLGRRPAYIVCFVLYIAANIGLALQTDYVALALLRCLQSAGSASTVALAKAVVADIATPDQRGRYSALTSMGIFLGPAIGPTIGGILAYYLGWRSVFWFLVIFAGAFAVMLVIGFPETCRKIVGNGSKRPATWNMSLVTFLHLRRNRAKNVISEDASAAPKLKMPKFWDTIRIALEKEMSIITVTSGLVFCSFYAITTTVPALFASIYSYNTIQIGLCFIAVAGGSFAAAFMQGTLVDWNYRRHARLLGMPIVKGKAESPDNFPLETARLEIATPLVGLLSLCTLAYGWVVEYETHVAGPLVILFFAGFASSSAYSIITVLIIDIHPSAPAAATAGNNLVRCLLAAGATAAIFPMIGAMGRGWAFTLMAAINASVIPLLLLCMKKGPQWRAANKTTNK